MKGKCTTSYKCKANYSYLLYLHPWILQQNYLNDDHRAELTDCSFADAGLGLLLLCPLLLFLGFEILARAAGPEAIPV
jgi:hypothetical protein